MSCIISLPMFLLFFLTCKNFTEEMTLSLMYMQTQLAYSSSYRALPSRESAASTVSNYISSVFLLFASSWRASFNNVLLCSLVLR